MALVTVSVSLHYGDSDWITLAYARDTCAISTGTATYVATAGQAATEAPACDPADYWHTPISYSVGHVSAYHLWQNMVILFLAGLVLELTESAARMFLTVMISAPLSAGGHGLVFPNRLLGMSGVVYAVILYQFGLLIKNFREMRFRPRASRPFIAYRAALSAAPTRLVIAALLLLSEIILSADSVNVSHAGHVTGALAGIACGLAFGSNVLIDPLEIVLPFLGVLALFGIIFAILASGQVFVVLWAWFAVLAAIPLVYKEIIRWTEVWQLVYYPGTWSVTVAPRVPP